MQNVLKRGFGLFVVVSLVLLAGCAGMMGSDKGSKAAMADKSLYDRLGGKEAITAVVDEFVARVAADTRINSFFGSTDIPKFKMLLVDQICEASGGPCKYTGRDMVTTHTGMGVTDDHFNALVEDLVGALDKFKVPEKEKGELLAVLGPMRKDIVGK